MFIRYIPDKQNHVSFPVVRGFLLDACIIQHGDCLTVFPKGTQVEVRSNEYWYHETSPADVQKAVSLIKKETNNGGMDSNESENSQPA